MPGYNHYPWCVCGWCYKQGQGVYSPDEHAELERSFERWSAARFLRAEGAEGSFSACFVAPNATCPVCGARVFFFANRFGSRVYFDELGWPWPKHTCTDRPRARVWDQGAPQPLSPRARGIRIEIADAAKRAGFSPLERFVQRHGGAPWDTFLIKSVIRIGFLNVLEAKPISPEADDIAYFEFTSAKVVPSENDYFSFKEDLLSVLDETLTPRKFQARPITRERFEVMLARTRS